MKTKLSKKVISFLLCVILVVTSLPMFAFTALADGIDAVSAEYEALTTAMETYESKMDGTIYKNMSTAYAAYIAAQKTLDAYTYGDVTSADLASAATTLSNATKSMVEWTAPVFDAQAYHCTNVATDGYSNVVYTSGNASTDETSFSSEASDAGIQVKIAVPKLIVIAYDGKNEASIPAVLETLLPGKSLCSAQVIQYAASTDSTMYFDGVWNGYMDGNYTAWAKDNIATEATLSAQSSDTSHTHTPNNKNTSRFWWNKLIYHGTGNTTDYYEKFSNSGLNVYCTYTNWGSKTTTISPTATNDIYVINYKPIADKVSDLSTKFTTAVTANSDGIASYSEGGLAKVILALDKFTADSVNPKTYAYTADTAETNVQACANAIKTALASYTTDAEVGAADAAGYQALREALRERVRNTYATGSEGYTEESWQNFETAYVAAHKIFENIQTTGYDNAAAAQSAADALETAFNNLELNTAKVDTKALETIIDNAVVAEDNKSYFTTASYNDSDIENVVAAAQTAIWTSPDKYKVETAKPIESEENQAKVTAQENAVKLAVSKLVINPDATVAAARNYSLTSAVAEAANYNPADYSNYNELQNAIADANLYVQNANIDASIAGDTTAKINAYKANVKAIVDAIRNLHPAFSNMPNGTIANAGSSESVSMTHKQTSGAYSGTWTTTVTRPNNVIAFRTTHTEDDILLGDMNVNFYSSAQDYDGHLDSINFGDINETTGQLSSTTGDDYGLGATVIASYPGSVSISAGGGYGEYRLNNLYVTQGTAQNGVLGKDANGSDVTSSEYDFAALIGKTNGAAPVAGVISARNGETQTRGDFVLHLIAETPKDLSATTKPTKKDYSVSSYMGAVNYWKYYAVRTWAGYAHERTAYTQNTTVIDISYLIDLVNLCGTLNYLDYTKDTWDALDAALTAAKDDNFDYASMSADDILAECVTRYDNLYNAYIKLASPLSNQEIVDAVNATRATYAAGNTQYSQRSWAVFAEKYEAARDSIADTGIYATKNIREIANNDTNKAAIKAVADELLAAYNALESTADFSPVDNAARNLIAGLEDNKYSVKSLEAIKTSLANFEYYSRTDAERTATYADEQENINNEAAEISALTASLPTVTEETLKAALDSVKADIQDPDAWEDVQSIKDYINSISPYEAVTYFEGTDYETAVQGMKYADQTDIDNEVTTILSMLVPQKYTVTVVSEDGSQLSQQTYNFGDTANVASPTGEKVDWYYEYTSNTSSNTSKYYTTDKRIEFIVKGNTILKVKSASDAETVKVTYVSSISGSVFAVDYVSKGACVAELPSKPTMPYFVAGDFTYNGSAFTTSTPVENNITVVLPYTATETEAMFSVTIANIDGEFNEDEISASVPIYYNDKISITAEGLAASKVYVNGNEVAISQTRSSSDDIYCWTVFDGDIAKVIYYGADYTFYAHEDVYLIAFTKAEYDQNVEDGLVDTSNLFEDGAAVTVRSDVLTTETKFSMIGTYALPAGCTMVECGILMSKNAGADLTLNNVGSNGVVRLKSSQHTAGNQFVISVTKPTSLNSVSFDYCAYFIYVGTDGSQHTALSDTFSKTVSWA